MACAKGKRGANGALCPLVENAPRKDIEFTALHILAEGGHKFIYAGHPPRIVGFDWALLTPLIEQSRADKQALLALLIEAEKTIITRINKEEDDASG